MRPTIEPTAITANFSVMAGLPAIHVFLVEKAVKTWMPGTRPGMTLKLTRFRPHLKLSRRHGERLEPGVVEVPA